MVYKCIEFVSFKCALCILLLLFFYFFNFLSFFLLFFIDMILYSKWFMQFLARKFLVASTPTCKLYFRTKSSLVHNQTSFLRLSFAQRTLHARKLMLVIVWERNVDWTVETLDLEFIKLEFDHPVKRAIIRIVAVSALLCFGSTFAADLGIAVWTLLRLT